MKRLIQFALLFISSAAVAGSTSAFVMGDMHIVLPSDWLGPTIQHAGNSVGYNLQRPRPGSVFFEVIHVQDTDVSKLLSRVEMSQQDVQGRADAAANTCLNILKSSAFPSLTSEPLTRCSVSDNKASCVNWSASAQDARISGVCVGWMTENRHIRFSYLSDASEHASSTVPAMLSALKSMQPQ